MRVAHLISHPVQYFAPLYRELARRDEIELTVFFYSDATARPFVDAGFGREVEWDMPLLDGYQHRFLPSACRTPIGGPFLRRPNLDVVRAATSGSFDVLWVHGYAHVTTWLAVAAARARGMRVLIRDEQTLLHGRPLARRVAKEAALRGLYACSSGMYIGEQNRQYFRRYGMPESRLWPAPYCVDNEYLQRRSRELRAERERLRAQFDLPAAAPVVLFAGKLIEKKQPLLLLEAFARVRREMACGLLFAGEGALRADAERFVGEHDVPDVRFAGFLNQTELPEAYAAADIFVLPSKLHETWGLVVNEAMNFELPVVVSDKVGCAADLVRHGRNGYVVRHDSVDELSSAIARLVADEGLRRRFGAESLAAIDGYSIERCADCIVDACLGRRAYSTRLRELQEAA
jgi:glycosyltransferase involved in cell wall biosynthesis